MFGCCAPAHFLKRQDVAGLDQNNTELRHRLNVVRSDNVVHTDYGYRALPSGNVQSAHLHFLSGLRVPTCQKVSRSKPTLAGSQSYSSNVLESTSHKGEITGTPSNGRTRASGEDLLFGPSRGADAKYAPRDRITEASLGPRRTHAVIDR